VEPVNFTKKTLFWIIVLITLSGAFYFFEQKVQDTRRSQEASLRLFPLAVQDVTEFWISHNREGLKLQVLKTQEGWQLIEPVSVIGDADAIGKLLRNVITARKDAVLFARAEPAKLKELGLDVPDIEMGFRAKGEETVIMFGASGPTHNVAYAMFKGNPNVFRVHSDVREEARKDVYALRDKTVLDIQPLKMRRLEAERKGHDRVIIEHDKGKWNMLEPAKGRASMEKVVESLFEIKNARVKSFTDANPSDLAAYGLYSPRLKLTIFQEERDAPYLLSIGGRDRENRGYFVVTNQSENVFTVEEDMVNAILLNMEKWSEM
jgi:hypothetical protein